MSVFFFFLVSTLLHGLVLSLPVPSENPGQQAIPFTFMVMERASPTTLPQGRADTDIKPTKPPSNPPVAVTKVQNEHEPVSALGKKGDFHPKPTQAGKTKPAVTIARLEKRPLEKEKPRKPKTETSSPQPISKQVRRVQEVELPRNTSKPTSPRPQKVLESKPDESQPIEWEEESLDWARLDSRDEMAEVMGMNRPSPRGNSRPKPTHASKTKPAVIIARLEKKPQKKEKPLKTKTSLRPVGRQANQVREIIPVTTASDFVPPTSSASVKKRGVEGPTPIAWEEDSRARLDHHDWMTEATGQKRPGSPAVAKKAIPTQSLARRTSPKFIPAAYATWAPPDYPERARRKGWQGTTLLRVLVNSRGKSETVEISRSSGFSILDGAAVKAVQRWRFRPAHDGRKTVESWVKVPIVFRLENAK